MKKHVSYKYNNLPIPGGGYVTGFEFNQGVENILYIRTDIGGVYRYSYEENVWHSKSEHVNMLDLSETNPAAIATDKNDSERLYVISGLYQKEGELPKLCGKFSISMDGGKTYIHKPIPCFVHGNLSGRGSGTRLIVDYSRPDTLYYASQRDGLFRTTNLGDSWELLETGGDHHMTFVWCSDDGQTIITACAGVDTAVAIEAEQDNEELEMLRGHSLYISYDAGLHFEELSMPEVPDFNADCDCNNHENDVPAMGVTESEKQSKGLQSAMNGYVAHRYDYDGKYFYCTINVTGPYYWDLGLSYSCDCGQLLAGKVLRYSFGGDGRILGYEEITPSIQATDCDGIVEIPNMEVAILPYGFGGVSSCKAMPGLVAVSTICLKGYRDMIYISKDYGETWEVALYDLSIGNLQFDTLYMKPIHNGGRSLVHWMSDIKINPFNPDEIWFNTGTGVFKGENFTKDSRSFRDCCRGINETVHLNVYSPIDGPVKVIDIVGDLGGFAFTDYDTECENTFADENGNRYITCINADASDLYPNEVVVTARGNWSGTSKGGVIWSHDYGQSFERLQMPYGISDYIDARCKRIEHPNVNPGWVAFAPDTKSLVYCLADGCDLYMKGIVTSTDSGKSFSKTKIYGFDKSSNNALNESNALIENDALNKGADLNKYIDLSNSDLHMKVFADRQNSAIYYGFGDDFTIYISMDCGKSFYQIETPISLPGLCTGLIDCANKTEIRGEAGKSGVFYAAFREYGLWKLSFHFEVEMTLEMRRIGCSEDIFYCIGLGILSKNSNYLTDDKALYTCAIIDGEYGFYRSFDDGKSFERISDEAQQFGIIQSMDGDSREYGRFVFATGSFGLKYGEPVDL